VHEYKQAHPNFKYTNCANQAFLRNDVYVKEVRRKLYAKHKHGEESMRVKVEEIGAAGLNLDFSYTLDDLPVLAEMQGTEDQKSGGLKFVTPVECKVRLSKIAQLIELSCSVRVTVALQCSRCLQDLSVELPVEFKQTYAKELPDVVDETDGEVEITAEDMGLTLFDGETIDLRDEIQQQIVLAVPTHPLCADKCKGLCLTCGANLNKGVCNCSTGNISMHFASLRDFKVDK